MAKKPSELEIGAKQILQQQGTTDFSKWKKEQIDKRKFALLQGDDTKWEESVLEEAYLSVVLKKLKQH